MLGISAKGVLGKLYKPTRSIEPFLCSSQLASSTDSDWLGPQPTLGTGDLELFKDEYVFDALDEVDADIGDRGFNCQSC